MNAEVKIQHNFDEAIAISGEPGQFQAQVSSAYQNMVGPFGGITAAQILNSVMVNPERVGEPTAMTVNFAGPIKGKALSFNTRLMRANRSNQHWTVDVESNGELVCTATLVFATRVETWPSVELEMPEALPMAELAPSPKAPTPPWVSQYEMRCIKGNAFLMEEPERDGNQSETLVWMKDKPARALDFLSLTALCDAFFPRLFVRRKQFVPIGTVTISIYFHTSVEDLAALDSPEVLGCARASKFSGNYFDQTAEVWSADGQLLATTSQFVYYKN